MKLLKRTVRSYLIYSVLVLLVAIPLFYFIIQALCLQDVDQALVDRKSFLSTQLKTHPEILAQLPWHDMSGGMDVLPPVNASQSEQKVTLQRYSTMSGEEEPFRELRTALPVDGRFYPVILRISLIDMEDLIQGIVLTAILLMMMILGGLLWINRGQSRKIWRPFYQMVDQLQHFSLNREPDLHYTPTDITEFKDLQRAITQLAERTYSTYLQQKEFTENAAHEMQTPLATLQARLEVLMQDESLTEQQSAHIQALGDSVIRMSKLNHGLLLLAKIENRQFRESEAVNLFPMVTKMLRQFEIQLQMKRLRVSESCEDCVVNADPVLIDILLSNLLNNAIQYAPEGSEVSVTLTTGQLVISNGGDPLPFGEDRLFHRFQKGNLTAHPGGTGLGLAIVRQICETCGFSIHHRFSDHCHHFSVQFHDGSV